MNEVTTPHEPVPLSRQRHIRREDIDALILSRLGQDCYCTLSSGLWRLWRDRTGQEPDCLTGQHSGRALVEWIENYQEDRSEPVATTTEVANQQHRAS